MNIRLIGALLYISIILVVCKNEIRSGSNSDLVVFDLTSVPANNGGLPLSEIAESVTYISLETNENSIIGRVRKIVHDKHIYYVLADDAIVKFDEEGKFIGKIRRVGRGPEEYHRIRDFDINPIGGKLAVATGDKIIFYDTNGLFRSSIMCNANFIDFINNEELMIYRSNMLGINRYSHMIVNEFGDTLAKFQNKFKFELKNKSVGLPNWEYLSYRIESDLYMSEIQDDTLFKVMDNHSLKPYAVFNTGGCRITAMARSDGTYFEKNFSDFIFLTTILESSRYMFYSFQSNMGIYDKRNHTLSYFKNITNDFDGGIDFSPEYMLENNRFIAVASTAKLKSHIDSQAFKQSKVKDKDQKRKFLEFVNGLSEEDNPVIIKVKLKSN